MAKLEGTSYFVAISSSTLAAVKFDISNIGNTPQVFNGLSAYSHHACSQAITNHVATTYWVPHEVQIFDSTTGNVLGFISIAQGYSGCGIIAVNEGSNQFVINGTYYGDLQKYSDSGLSLISSVPITGFQKLRSIAFIPGTKFITFG